MGNFCIFGMTCVLQNGLGHNATGHPFDAGILVASIFANHGGTAYVKLAVQAGGLKGFHKHVGFEALPDSFRNIRP
jgi:hypothetical protein